MQAFLAHKVHIPLPLVSTQVSVSRCTKTALLPSLSLSFSFSLSEQEGIMRLIAFQYCVVSEAVKLPTGASHR